MPSELWRGTAEDSSQISGTPSRCTIDSTRLTISPRRARALASFRRGTGWRVFGFENGVGAVPAADVGARSPAAHHRVPGRVHQHDPSLEVGHIDAIRDVVDHRGQLGAAGGRL